MCYFIDIDIGLVHQTQYREITASAEIKIPFPVYLDGSQAYNGMVERGVFRGAGESRRIGRGWRLGASCLGLGAQNPAWHN